MIRLRALEPEDVEFLMECESDPESGRWSDYRAPFSRQQLLTYILTYDADPISAGQIRLIAENDGMPVGIIDFYEISERDSRAYVGITIHPLYRGMRLARPALESAAQYAFNSLGLAQIDARVSTQNTKGLTLFREAGYKESAILLKWIKIGNRWHDIIIFQKFFCNFVID